MALTLLIISYFSNESFGLRSTVRLWDESYFFVVGDPVSLRPTFLTTGMCSAV